MTKKILMITQNFYPEIGSAGNRAKNIYKLLSDKGYDVQVLTTEPTYPNRNIYDDETIWDDKEISDASNIERIVIKNRKYSSNIMNRLLYYLKVAFKMLRVILFDKNKYDVVYTTSPPIFIAMIGLIAKYKYRSKLILDVRDLWPESLKGVGVFNYKLIIWFFRKIEKTLYKRSDEILVNSEGFIDYIEDVIPSNKEKLTYIPNGANYYEIESMKRVTKENDGVFHAIYAGNIGLAQDYELLKDIALGFHENDISFTIIGYGVKYQELKEFIVESELGNIQLLSPMTRDECLHIISEHDVGIVTLKDEKVFETVLPGKVVDYMTCGIPIIGSVSGTAKDIIIDNDAGFVIPNNDIKKMVDMIEHMKNNTHIAVNMSNNAKKIIKQSFLWDENIFKLEELIDEKSN